MGSKTPIADRYINESADGRFLGMNATQECADAFRRLESALAMAEEALNDAPTEWGEAPWKKGGA